VRAKNLQLHGIKGRRIDAYQEGTTSYASTFDSALTTLKVKYCYNDGFQRVVPLLMLHGFAESSTALITYDYRPLADKGFLVLMPDMRGRNGSSGTQDASGREILDIYDALLWARSGSLGPDVDPERAVIVGFSGGGGNVHATAVKLPDIFSFRVSYFGISDYGESESTSWYIQAPGQDATLDSWVGSPRASVMEYYKSRNAARLAAAWMALEPSIRNRYRLYHDYDDGTVSRTHSVNVSNALTTAIVPHTFSESTSLDVRRYQHGYPHDRIPDLLDSFSDWMISSINAVHWSVPAKWSGTGLKVGGFVITRRFEIWTGPTASPTPKADTTHGGKEVVCELLSYDVNTGVYSVRPHTTCYVQIIQGSRSVIQQVTENTIANLTVA